MRKGIKCVVVLSCVVLLLVSMTASAKTGWNEKTMFGCEMRHCKNVIVLIPDGCSASIQTASRWYKEYALGSDEPLALDMIGTCGAVKTWMANSIITDSASASTAFACGVKTTDGFLGVAGDPDYPGKPFLTGYTCGITPYAPVQSDLEAAKLAGKAVGLVATSRITHATPAGYAAHVYDRNLDNDIMEQMVYQDIDVVLGGGARHLVPSGQSYETTFGDVWGGKRTDGENLIDELIARGYQFVDNKDDLAAVRCGKVWGMFDDSHMDPELDRDDLHPTQPSLAEMTRKAIDLLSRNRCGFFLMVEGSQVDWAGHANDPVYMITDFLAFDDAVKVAYDYAKRRDDTIVIAFPDHNTGGLTIGHQQRDTTPPYTNTTVEDLIAPIKDAGMTIQSLLYLFPANSETDQNTSVEGVRATLAATLGDWWADEANMSNEQAQVIVDIWNDLGAYDGYYPIAQYMSREFMSFGWTTHGHCGEDVPLWCYAGRRCERPVGLIDNTELAKIVADELGVRLRGTTMWLEFDESVLDMSDPANPVAVIRGVRFPVNKDIAQIGFYTLNLNGITVWATQSGKVYIPLR